MSIAPKSFHYQGKHCFQACQASMNGKMCQCKFDRRYERQCFEEPGKVTPAVVADKNHIKE